MPQFRFRSLRGDDFIAEGNTPHDAYKNLIESEKENGTLWKLNDSFCNQYAVNHLGYTALTDNDYSPVYIEIKE